MDTNQINFHASEDVVIIAPTLPLLEEITSHLKRDGLYCLDKSLDLNALAIFQNEILNLINSKVRRYFSLINPYKNIESNFNLMEKSHNLKNSFLN
jgi:hypothetical protein